MQVFAAPTSCGSADRVGRTCGAAVVERHRDTAAGPGRHRRLELIAVEPVLASSFTRAGADQVKPPSVLCVK